MLQRQSASFRLHHALLSISEPLSNNFPSKGLFYKIFHDIKRVLALASERLSVWASECLSVRASERPSVWASERLSVRASERPSVRASERLSVWVWATLWKFLILKYHSLVIYEILARFMVLPKYIGKSAEMICPISFYRWPPRIISRQKMDETVPSQTFSQENRTKKKSQTARPDIYLLQTLVWTMCSTSQPRFHFIRIASKCKLPWRRFLVSEVLSVDGTLRIWHGMATTMSWK